MGHSVAWRCVTSTMTRIPVFRVVLQNSWVRRGPHHHVGNICFQQEFGSMAAWHCMMRSLLQHPTLFHVVIRELETNSRPRMGRRIAGSQLNHSWMGQTVAQTLLSCRTFLACRRMRRPGSRTPMRVKTIHLVDYILGHAGALRSMHPWPQQIQGHM